MHQAWADVAKLLLAACLGGAIGLERQTKHRPAGLRTNLFICMGAALFTLLSDQLAGAHTGDHTRIAAQIIPGIGFIGAGLYLIAVFATLLILGVLLLLGGIERWLNLKIMVHAFEVSGRSAELVTANVNGVLEPLHFMMMNTQIAPTPQHIRVRFECEGTREQHAQAFSHLERS